MRQLIIAACLALSPFVSSAQEPTIAALFKEMPDSLMPYLTKNNRLDMLDFMEARMKAEVTNLFDGKSEMTALTADSLTIKMSPVLTVSLKLVKVQEPIDSSNVTISMKRTYVLNESQAASVVDVYTAAWRLLSSRVDHSTILKRDDDVFSRPHL